MHSSSLTGATGKMELWAGCISVDAITLTRQPGRLMLLNGDLLLVIPPCVDEALTIERQQPGLVFVCVCVAKSLLDILAE